MMAGNDKNKISLEVISGPLDGLVVRVEKPNCYLGRAEEGVDKKTRERVRNDLVLQRDSYASSVHALLFQENGRWFLEDRQSMNGTFLAGNKMEPFEPAELYDRELFVAGNTIVRFEERELAAPPIDPSANSRLSMATQTILNRARALAKDWNLGWLGASPVFHAIARTETEHLTEFFERVKLDPAQANETVKNWVRWKGDFDWINGENMPHRKLQRRGGSSLLPTPRFQTILTLADEAREKTGAQRIEPIHLLAGIFMEGHSHVALALEEAGFDLQKLAKQALKTAREEEAAPAEAAPKPEEPAASTDQGLAPPAAPEAASAAGGVLAPAKPKRPPRKPVDPAIWMAARELMDRLQAVQRDYRLAEPDVRFEALCNCLREGLQKTPPDQRKPLCEVLYGLFPVLEDAVLPPPPNLGEAQKRETEEPTDGHVHTDEAPPEEPEQTPMQGVGVDTDYLMQKIFGSERMATMAQMGEENEFMRVMQHLYTFAQDMEQLAKGLVQSVQGGGSSDSRYFLPFQAYDLKSLIEKLLEQEDPQTVVDIRNYLRDLGHWLIALVAAHQRATAEWNHELWEKISPQAVRNEAKISSLNKMLGQGKAELWETYERVVARDLKPEITDDMLSERIGRMTTEEFHKLSAGK